MSFSVYNTNTGVRVVSIENTGKVYIHPILKDLLSVIKPHTCFPFFMMGQSEELFGKAKSITPENPLYPKALQMYLETNFLTHPESWTTQQPYES